MRTAAAKKDKTGAAVPGRFRNGEQALTASPQINRPVARTGPERARICGTTLGGNTRGHPARCARATGDSAHRRLDRRAQRTLGDYNVPRIGVVVRKAVAPVMNLTHRCGQLDGSALHRLNQQVVVADDASVTLWCSCNDYAERAASVSRLY